MAKKTLLFLQGGGVLPDQFKNVFKDLEHDHDYEVIMFKYPLVFKNGGFEYAKFIKNKLTDKNISDLTIVTHSLGAFFAVELNNLLEKSPENIILISPLLSSVKENFLLFAAKSFLFSKTLPSTKLWFKWIINLPLWLSHLIIIKKINIDEKINNMKTQKLIVIITNKDKLISPDLQKEKLHLLNNPEIIEVNGDHGFILKSNKLLLKLLIGHKN